MADMTLDELRARLHPTGDDGEWFAHDELALMIEGIDAAMLYAWARMPPNG